ncbi:MAG: CotH kinase family protein [Cyclobacteriaceae bacterium]|nr:CotH kinase family protein [Cyclobacteriaceae bacterium]
MFKMHTIYRIVIIIWVILLTHTVDLYSQNLVVNELVSSNYAFYDEDGDTPDWFELYNKDVVPINLAGWSVSDKKIEPAKWIFPDFTMAPGDFEMIWASGKNRFGTGFPRTLISEGDVFSYIIPQNNISGWTSLAYNDVAWSLGASGFGYSDGDDNTVTPTGIASVFMRKKFTVQNLADITQLILDIDYDDGFVAYVNGIEVARANISGSPPAFNALTPVDHEAAMYRGEKPQRFNLSNPAAILVEGENILAIQVHNTSLSSSDLTLIPFLSVVYGNPSTAGIVPPAVLELPDLHFHTNFSIKNAADTLYLFNPQGILIDQLFGGNLHSGVSVGVDPANNGIAYFAKPTPDAANTTSPFLGVMENTINFSHNGGIVGNTLSLSVSSPVAGSVLRYTTDGTMPTETSSEYLSPLTIDITSNIWVRAFKTGYISGPGESRSYIFAVNHELPVLSLATDGNNLFHLDTGMYVLGSGYQGIDYPYFGSNIWEDWERPAHISLYEKDGTDMSLPVGIKIFGGWSRAQAQRSFSIFARGKYGVNEINYPLFPERAYQNFQAFVLRNSGNDWNNTMMRDATLTGLLRDADMERQAYRPVATYLNGSYWGIYNIREKVNEHFLASQHFIDPADVDLLESSGQVIHGDNLDYQNLINFVSTNDLSNDEVFKQVEYQVDIENFILYQLSQIFFDNTDWPGNNIKFWNHPTGKWRWILYDTDFGFGIWNRENYTNNTLEFALKPDGGGWPNPPWSTLLLRRFMENAKFREMFITRFCDELNSRFVAESVQVHIDTMAAVIRPEIQRHMNKWQGSYDGWNNQVQNMRYFASRRPSYLFVFLKREFNLSPKNKLTVNNDNQLGGFVKVNTVTMDEGSWSGEYFPETTITITAVPRPGYRFVGWTGDLQSTEAQLQVNLVEVLSVTARFELSEVSYQPVVINEINYNSLNSADPGDWVELHNPNEGYVDLSGWILSDSDDGHRFRLPEGTVIEGDGYLVLARNRLTFTQIHPTVTNFVGDFKYGLSNTGEHLRLYDKLGNLLDSVNYNVLQPWPELANGQGPTLELVDAGMDNTLAESWKTYSVGGSPGRKNGIDTGIIDPEQAVSVYPNPMGQRANVSFSLKSVGDVSLRLLDVTGRILKTVEKANLGAGQHLVLLDVYDLQRGVYFVQLQMADREETLQVVKF